MWPVSLGCSYHAERSVVKRARGRVVAQFPQPVGHPEILTARLDDDLQLGLKIFWIARMLLAGRKLV
jgi:hypothetical protein